MTRNDKPKHTKWNSVGTRPISEAVRWRRQVNSRDRVEMSSRNNPGKKQKDSRLEVNSRYWGGDQPALYQTVPH